MDTQAIIAEYATRQQVRQIPKILHFVWVGDDAKCPHDCIETWRRQHPDWELKVWGNDDYRTRPWRLKRHMEVMWNHELNGVADMMRYEILFAHGGVALDADSICLAPLPDWILECEAVAASEKEAFAPGRLACGFMATKPQNPFFDAIVTDLKRDKNALHKTILGFRYKIRPAWKSVGPRCLSRAFRKYRYANMTILPSHFFFAEKAYTGGGPIFAHQLWNSTNSGY